MRRPTSRWRRLLRHFRRDERGNIALLFAVFMALGTLAGALAVDEGALYLQRRTAQSAVDLAAISAASDPADAFALARQALADAGLITSTTSDATLANSSSPTQLSVDAGAYSPDPSLAVAARYQSGTTPANAVHVRFRMPGALYFAQRWGHDPAIGVEAVASTNPIVRFSVGSTLAALSDGVPNAVLNALLGANVSLTAASYNGLLDTHVSLFGFLDALAQELSITAGTYDDVLAASADQGTIARAVADTVTGADRTAALALAQVLGHNGRVPIGSLFNLGDAAGLAIGTGASSGYTASLSALQLLAASGAVSDGTHEVSLNLAASVPGLTSLTMNLAVGEPAQFATWFALGPSGTIARTAQVRVKFVATLAGGPALLGASVRLPLYLEVAYARAGVQSATCPAGGAMTGTAVIAAQPGVASLTIGDVPDPAFSSFAASPTPVPATLINAALLDVTGSGTASIGQTTATPLSFSVADISSGTLHRATTSTFTQSLGTSLLQHMTLGVTAFGLGVTTTSVGNALASLLAPLTPVLDGLIDSALATLGLTLGNADVEVYGVTCPHPVLVR